MNDLAGEKLCAMWMEFPELTDEEKEDDDLVVIFGSGKVATGTGRSRHFKG